MIKRVGTITAPTVRTPVEFCAAIIRQAYASPALLHCMFEQSHWPEFADKEWRYNTLAAVRGSNVVERAEFILPPQDGRGGIVFVADWLKHLR